MKIWEVLLSVVSLIGIVFYFVTISDSGSLAIDTLSANGHQDPPVLQRIFWALTEGACATALLVAGGEDALKAVCSGLPSGMLLCFMCVSLWRAMKFETDKTENLSSLFCISLLDVFDNCNIFSKFVMALFISLVFSWLCHQENIQQKHCTNNSNCFISVFCNYTHDLGNDCYQSFLCGINNLLRFCNLLYIYTFRNSAEF